MEYIIIGSKPYVNINCNTIIDSFQNNIRCNLYPALEKYNSGTKIDNYIFNIHVSEYIKSKLTNKHLRSTYVDIYDEEYMNDVDTFFRSNIKKIKSHTANWREDKVKFNKFLKQNNIKLQFQGDVIRIGYSTIIYAIKNNINKIYVSGFGIQNNELIKKKNNELINIYEKKKDGCHIYNNEIEILIELHKHNIIDATMCTLVDNNLPTFDCSYFNLKYKIIGLFFIEYGISIFINKYKSNDIKNEIKERSNINFISLIYYNYYKKKFNYLDIFENCDDYSSDRFQTIITLEEVNIPEYFTLPKHSLIMIDSEKFNNKEFINKCNPSLYIKFNIT